MVAPNMINVGWMYGRTAVQHVGTTSTSIISNPMESDTVYKINTLIVGNLDTTTTYYVTVEYFDGTNTIQFLSSVSVPAKTYLNILSRTLYLEEGCSLKLYASAASKLEAIVSYETIA